MDPGYETVLDASEFVWTMAAYVVHGAIVALHAGLAAFLLATGAHGLLAPGRDGPWLRRLGITTGGAPRGRGSAGLRVVLGMALLAPFALGAPMAASLLAAIAAIVVLVGEERGLAAAERRSGRLARIAAVASAAVAILFMLWEGEDNLALGSGLLFSMMEWRSEEVDWQLALDPRSPKVGDLAPDFELQDPEGRVQVRLSDFRGKRPVALVFGSYT